VIYMKKTKISYARVWEINSKTKTLVTTVPKKHVKILGIKKNDRVHVTLEAV